MIRLAVLIALLAGPATANVPCGPREAIVGRLAAEYSESRQFIGLAQTGVVAEIFVSEANGTWTITLTSPNGRTCMLAAGIAFENLAEPPVVPGSDG